MAHGVRHSAPSPAFSSASSSSARKHHRKTIKGCDYIDKSPSQSPFEEEDEQSMYTESASSDQFSLPPFESMQKGKSTSKPSSSSLEYSSSDSLNRFKKFSYVNIAPLPIFKGSSDECAVTHLSRFAKVCRANNVCSVEMMMRIFAVTLDGEAALWYDLNIEPYSSLSWEEIKSSFLQAYHQTVGLADQLRSELMMIHQGSQESVRSYFLRLQWILKRWPDHGLPEGLLEGIFIDGLGKDFQDWIIPQKPSSLNEALRLAFGWEKVRSIRGGGETACGFCSGRHEEKGCEIRERMRRLWLQSKQQQTGDLPARIENKGEDDGEELAGRVSVGGLTDDRNNEGEERMAGFKKSQCQCWKHQCWKKLERSSSLLITPKKI